MWTLFLTLIRASLIDNCLDFKNGSQLLRSVEFSLLGYGYWRLVIFSPGVCTFKKSYLRIMKSFYFISMWNGESYTRTLISFSAGQRSLPKTNLTYEWVTLIYSVLGINIDHSTTQLLYKLAFSSFWQNETSRIVLHYFLHVTLLYIYYLREWWNLWKKGMYYYSKHQKTLHNHE